MNKLQELREEYGLQQQEFCAQFGVKPNTYSNYEKGLTEPKIGFWIAVADRYKVSLDYLMGQTDEPHGAKWAGKSKIEERYSALDEYGKKLVDTILELEAERIGATEPPQEQKIVDFGTIRRYLSRPAAGVNGLVEGEDYEDIPRTATTPPKADFCVVVSGDSMEPYIHDGETVYIDESAPVGKMDVGLFYVDGATYIKQYAPSYDGSVYLLSANPDREDANVTIPRDSTSSLVCFGKVIMKKKLPPPVYK